jgi:hypothetical protein
MAIILTGSTGVATPAVVDASGGNTATINSMTPTADSLQGFRNRIINGDMRIDQRNAGASYTQTGAAGQYSLDRWNVSGDVTSKFSVQQNAGSVTPPTGFTNYLGATSLSAYSVPVSEAYIIRQQIEGFNVADLAWGTASAKTVTLSFWVRSSLTGTFGGVLKNSGNNRSYPFTYTISAANTWEQETVTIAGDTSGTWLTNNGIGLMVIFSLGSGSSVSGTAGAWAASSLFSATGAVSVVGTNAATWYVTGVQLEVGSVATPFERRDYGRELIMCQRYYYRIKPDVANGCIAEIAHGTATTNARGRIVFPVTMRTRPTALEQSGTAGDYDVQLGSGVTVCSAVPTIASGTVTTTQVAVVDFPVASGLTIGQAGNIRTPSPGNGYLAWSAEL